MSHPKNISTSFLLYANSMLETKVSRRRKKKKKKGRVTMNSECTYSSHSALSIKRLPSLSLTEEVPGGRKRWTVNPNIRSQIINIR